MFFIIAVFSFASGWLLRDYFWRRSSDRTVDNAINRLETFQKLDLPPKSAKRRGSFDDVLPAGKDDEETPV